MVKYLHVRKLGSDGKIGATGGLTVAYTHTETDIMLQVAACHDDDLFCYELGRRIARNRLQSKKVMPWVIKLEHPIKQTILTWIMCEYFDEIVDIHLDAKGRFVSDFVGCGFEHPDDDDIPDYYPVVEADMFPEQHVS